MANLGWRQTFWLKRLVELSKHVFTSSPFNAYPPDIIRDSLINSHKTDMLYDVLFTLLDNGDHRESYFAEKALPTMPRGTYGMSNYPSYEIILKHMDCSIRYCEDADRTWHLHCRYRSVFSGFEPELSSKFLFKALIEAGNKSDKVPEHPACFYDSCFIIIAHLELKYIARLLDNCADKSQTDKIPKSMILQLLERNIIEAEKDTSSKMLWKSQCQLKQYRSLIESRLGRETYERLEARSTRKWDESMIDFKSRHHPA